MVPWGAKAGDKLVAVQWASKPRLACYRLPDSVTIDPRVPRELLEEHRIPFLDLHDGRAKLYMAPQDEHRFTASSNLVGPALHLLGKQRFAATQVRAHACF